MNSAMRLPFSLQIITDAGPRTVERVHAALRGASAGGVAVQLRNKSVGAGELLEQARALRAITRAHDALLLINDRVDVAIACQADGVHLPSMGMRPDDARALIPPGSLIGVSCHARDDLERAANLGADYAALSPVFSVDGKGPPLGVEGFGMLAHQARLPVIALGGISRDHVEPLMRSGASGVAVIRAILSANEPDRATADFLHILSQGHISRITR